MGEGADGATRSTQGETKASISVEKLGGADGIRKAYRPCPERSRREPSINAAFFARLQPFS